ncbi:hypothetical protein D3C85_1229590 [compost metagenome]
MVSPIGTVQFGNLIEPELFARIWMRNESRIDIAIGQPVLLVPNKLIAFLKHDLLNSRLIRRTESLLPADFVDSGSAWQVPVITNANISESSQHIRANLLHALANIADRYFASLQTLPGAKEKQLSRKLEQVSHFIMGRQSDARILVACH